MGKGKKNHLKRLNAPKNWHLSKMKGIFAPMPLPGPHKAVESIPLLVLLRNTLGFAKTAKEAKIILERGHVVVNGKVRREPHFPCGLMDILHLPAIPLTRRLIINSSGNWALVAPSYDSSFFSLPLRQTLIPSEVLNFKALGQEGEASSEQPQETKRSRREPKEPREAREKSSSPRNVSVENSFASLSAKTPSARTASRKPAPGSSPEGFPSQTLIQGKIELGEQDLRLEKEKTFLLPCKVRKIGLGNKKAVGVNPAGTTPEEKMIPWATTECGRTLRYVDKTVRAGDTLIVKIKSEECKAPRKFMLQNYKTEEEIVKCLKMQEGNLGFVIRGKNKGRVGRIKKIEKHLKISDFVFMEDEAGHQFVTKIGNVFVIGEEKSEIGLARDRGVRMTLEEKVKFSIMNLKGEMERIQA